MSDNNLTKIDNLQNQVDALTQRLNAIISYKNVLNGMKTSTIGTSEFSLANTYMGKKVVNNAMMYDIISPYNEYAKSLIGNHIITSKAIEDMIVEIYNYYTGKKKHEGESVSNLHGSLGSEYPQIIVDNEYFAKAGDVLSVVIGNDNPITFLSLLNNRLTIKNVSIDYKYITTTGSDLTKDLRKINNRIDDVIGTIKDISGSRSYLLNDYNKIKREYIDTSWLSTIFATRDYAQDILAEHVNDNEKHLTQDQINNVKKIPDLERAVTNYKAINDSCVSKINKFEADINNALKTISDINANIDQSMSVYRDLFDESGKIKADYLPIGSSGGSIDEVVVNGLVSDVAKLKSIHSNVNTCHVSASDRSNWNNKLSPGTVRFTDLDVELRDMILYGSGGSGEGTDSYATDDEIKELFRT